MTLFPCHKVRTWIFSACLILTLGYARAQSHSGKVISQESSLELAQVKIFDADGKLVDSTNTQGFFKVRNPGEYVFQKDGYFSRSVEIDPAVFAVMPYIDYAVCSADFNPPGCSSSDDLLDYLEGFGLRGSAISRGAEPIIYRSRGQQGHIPVTQVEAIDTLGAGDILHGTFCHHILTSSFPKSLKMAAQSATHSCLSYGTRQ